MSRSKDEATFSPHWIVTTSGCRPIAWPRSSKWPALQQGLLPNRQRWQCWCEQQPQLVDDPDFVEPLMMQFTAIATQLEDLASGLGISPLEPA